MAEERKIVIDVDVEAGDAQKRLETLEAAMFRTQENAAEMKDKMEQGFDAAGKGAKNASKGFKAVGTSVGSLLKSLGLVAIALEVFNFLKDILMKNQAVMDAVNTATLAFEILIKKLFNSVSDLAGPIRSVFEDPKQAVIDLGNLIKENIINRFEGAVLAVGAIGRTFKALFEADWDGALEGVKDYGQALIQVGTGLDADQQAAFVDGVKEFAEETIKATNAAVDEADALVALRNELKLLEAEQRKQILVSQNLAELERQKRDDISLTIEQRIEANKELGRILDEQIQIEEGIANKRLDLARRELALDRNNIDLKVEVINAETELADVRERINGQRSEQLTNQVALEKELFELQQELRTIGKTERELELEELLIEIERLEEIKRLASDTEVDIEEEKNRRLAELQDKWNKEDLAKQKKHDQDLKKQQDKVDKAKVSAAQGVAGALGQISSALQAAGVENQGFMKALAVGEIAINAAIATAAAIKNATSSSATVFDMVANIAVAVGTVAGAIASATTLLNQADGPPAPTMDVTAATPAPSIAAAATASTELGGAEQAQLAPIQAFVVETEMTGNQQNISQIENQVTFGIDG